MEERIVLVVMCIGERINLKAAVAYDLHVYSSECMVFSLVLIAGWFKPQEASSTDQQNHHV